jgi:hypothetical protein
VSRPLARPVARDYAPGNPRSGPGFPPLAARTDSAPSPSVRISARRLERIAADVSDLDRAVLAWVSDYRLATTTQLVRRFWPSDAEQQDLQARVGRRALKRLADWRVLDALPGRARGGVRGGSDTLIYSVGVAGAKLLARQGFIQKRLGQPSARRVTHTLSICEVAVRLHEADRAGDVECIEIQTEPRCWRRFLGPMGAQLAVRPDLYLRVAAPDSAYEFRWLCEVDLATENKGALLAKCRRYLAHYRSGIEQREHGIYPRVLWLAPDERRVGQIESVLHKLPLGDRGLFTVRRFDDAAEFLALEARK